MRVTDPVAEPPTTLRAAFISQAGWLATSREADLFAKLQNHDTWDLVVVDGGQWPMLTMPERLARAIHEIRMA